jgi:hypothetical protein
VKVQEPMLEILRHATKILSDDNQGNNKLESGGKGQRHRAQGLFCASVLCTAKRAKLCGSSNWLFRRPYTFIVAALLLLIVSPLVIMRTPTDIFPNIKIPVASIVWQYTGMLPREFAGRIPTVYERALTTTVAQQWHQHFLQQ